ncbi:MAG: DUF3341 domain-containing protein [Planctomycetota bacterium]
MAKSKTVLCIVPDSKQAQLIVADLERGGFFKNDISVLLPDKTGTRDFAHEHQTKAPEGAAAGAGVGGAIGGTLGWLTGIGSLALPGLGALIAAGPLLAALSGAAVGAAVGGLGGALIGMGVPEFEAKQYEGKIRGGNVLLSVHVEDSDTAKRVKEIYERNGGESIAVTGESKTPTSSRS